MSAAPAPAVPEEVSIDTAYGVTLEGILQLPKEQPKTGLVLCHPHPGLGGTMRTPLVARLAMGLVASGRPVLRFNFRGVGRSGGAQTGGELEPLDVAAAVAWLRSRLGIERPSLAGWSFGSLMAATHARTDSHLSALVVIAPPLSAMQAPSDLPAITAPKLWVVGDRDPFCPPGLIEGMPGEHVVVKGANHFFWAREDHLIGTVVDFLDRTGA